MGRGVRGVGGAVRVRGSGTLWYLLSLKLSLLFSIVEEQQEIGMCFSLVHAVCLCVHGCVSVCVPVYTCDPLSQGLILSLYNLGNRALGHTPIAFLCWEICM